MYTPRKAAAFQSTGPVENIPCVTATLVTATLVDHPHTQTVVSSPPPPPPPPPLETDKQERRPQLAVYCGSFKMVIDPLEAASREDLSIVCCVPLAPRGEVLMVTDIAEIQLEHEAFRQITLNFLKGWSTTAKYKLLKYCFVPPPRPAHCRMLTSADKARLCRLVDHHQLQKTKHIIWSKNSCAVQVKRYQPLNNTSVLQLVLRNCSCKSLETIRQSLAWVLLDMLLGCVLLHKQGMCHGDVKLNNFVYDTQSNRLKMIDFGALTRYDEGALEKKFGNMTYIWHHPIFTHLLKTSARPEESQNLAGMIDRFSFMGIVEQFTWSIMQCTLLDDEVKEKLRLSLRTLMYSFKRPDSKHGSNAVRQCQKFDRQCDRVMEDRIAFHESKKNHDHASEFCRVVKRHRLYRMLSWSGIFNSVVKWAWVSCSPRCLQNIATFVKSKRVSFNLCSKKRHLSTSPVVRKRVQSLTNRRRTPP